MSNWDANRMDIKLNQVQSFAPAPPAPTAVGVHRRRLSPAAGRALELLGHAIEYLADEYAASTIPAGPLGNADPRVEAIQILKRVNREVYYAGTCSSMATPRTASRIRRWFLGVKT